MSNVAASKKRLLAIVLDGVGYRKQSFGNAWHLAHTPTLDYLESSQLFSLLNAHGTHVGLPNSDDIGNSEVGHNAMGAGKIHPQGARLVEESIQQGLLYQGSTWQKLVSKLPKGKTLHFLGLLSDGNVHSHQNHLHSMLIQAKKEGVRKIRLHLLLDGRDVAEKSAEIYLECLTKELAELNGPNCDIKIASGGGRMSITMDRYQADWSMVQKGYEAHVLGKGRSFPTMDAALAFYRNDLKLADQFIQEFVITEKDKPVGTVEDGDSFIFFNFRGDRAIQFCQAMTEDHFPYFERQRFPKTEFAGMTQYDGDKHIPKQFLVSPPAIDYTLSEHLLEHGVTQFACSETQKFGHMTYFWNGNRSGFLDKNQEKYMEIPSDLLPFEEKPWMKAYEITEAVIKELKSPQYQFLRINFPNGDMVGHTGNLEASSVAMSTMDWMLHRILAVAEATDTSVVITADHGNCDDMFEKANPTEFAHWEKLHNPRPAPKTAHTLAPVPCYIVPFGQTKNYQLNSAPVGNLGNLANTFSELLGVPQNPRFEDSLLSS